MKLERQIMAPIESRAVDEAAGAAWFVVLSAAIGLSIVLTMLYFFPTRDHRPVLNDGRCPSGWHLERQPYTWICTQ